MRHRISILLALVVATFNIQAQASSANSQYLIKQLTQGGSESIRNASESIYRTHETDREVLDVLAETLLQRYPNAKDKYSGDAMAWACKGLAAAGDKRYYSVVKEVADKGDNRKMHKHCDRAADDLGSAQGEQYILGMVSLSKAAETSAASTGSSAIQVQPSMSGVKDGIAQLMRQNRNVINAALGGFEVKQVSSVDQLAFEVGAGFAGYNAELRASLSINNENRKNVYFAKLTQVYFDINTDIQNPNNLIAASNSNTNLVYINKVSYGRIAIIQVSSDYSKEEIQAALDFAYTGGNVSVDANAELNYNKVRQSSEIKGLFLGGNAENTVNVTNFDQLKSFNQYIQNGLRWNPNVVPTPVSYQLKYINDNTVATTQATTSFTQKNCIVGSGVKIKLHGIAIDETNNTCGCTWGNISVKLLEMDGNGNFVKEIFAKGGAGSEYWNVPGDRPTRVIKLSEVLQQDAKKTVNMDRFDAINAERIYTIDPEVYANNRVIVEFTMKATTDHKDNDFAKQGIHGMPRAETRTIPLQELIPESATKPTAEADKPLYTYKLGGFASNTDRIKIFNALFTISVAK